MKPAAPHAATPASMDFKRSLLDTFSINESANQLLLAHIAEAARQAPPTTGKGRSIASMACHIRHVRLMWLSASDKGARLPAKLEPKTATRGEVQAALKTSAEAIRQILTKSLEDPAGKVPPFKPNVVAFVGYLIAHDSHHRRQITTQARQVGHALPAKVGFGLWEWGSLWRDSGFAK
jgi:uncharacterized damage-inducible protein DinB